MKINFITLQSCYFEWPRKKKVKAKPILLRYFDSTWILTYPPQKWNCFNYCQSSIRSTNFCKSWYSKCNWKFLRSSPSFSTSQRVMKKKEVQVGNSTAQIEHRCEADLHNIFWLVSRHYASQKTIETIIKYMIDTFRNSTPAVNQKFVQKRQIETSTYHTVPNSKISLVNHAFTGCVELPPNV